MLTLASLDRPAGRIPDPPVRVIRHEATGTALGHLIIDDPIMSHQPTESERIAALAVKRDGAWWAYQVIQASAFYGVRSRYGMPAQEEYFQRVREQRGLQASMAQNFGNPS
jgi:hypothetical protein